MADRRQKIIGLAIMLGSIALFFWWGVHFRVFGMKITFSAAQIGFFVWLLLGMFGVGYAVGGWKSGLKVAGGFGLAVCVAVGIGFARGVYR
jgi:hypothetical protein